MLYERMCKRDISTCVGPALRPLLIQKIIFRKIQKIPKVDDFEKSKIDLAKFVFRANFLGLEIG